MNIAAILRAQAQERGAQPAIVQRGSMVTFGHLHDMAARGAQLLWGAGLRPGDPVLVFVPMSTQLYIVLTALFRLGLVAMVVDPSAGLGHLERCCALHPPKALVASPKAHLLRLMSPALRRIPTKFVTGPWLPGARPWTEADRLPAHAQLYPADMAAPALLTFTSGSTGQPKAALRTHGFLLGQHDVLRRTLRLEAGTVDMATLPIVLLSNLATGVTSLIPNADLRRPGMIDPAPVAAEILRHRVRSTAASPAFLERLVTHAEAGGITFATLEKIFTGGAPVFPRLLHRLQRMVPDGEAIAVYGSTEAEPIAHLHARDVLPSDLGAMRTGKGLLAGRVVEQIRLAILRPQWGAAMSACDEPGFAAAAVAPGEIGEIVVSGPHVLPGYLHGRGDEETKFRVNDTVWHRTGDAGFLDERGRLWLVGRAGARIADDRGELYPFSVETALSFDPTLHRTAVTAYGGKRILFIETESPPDPTTVEELRSSLSWASIDQVRWTRQLPVDKRHNAKIDYPALRRLLQRSGSQ